ncbi:unnamed protein product [Vitrella brassicaformis CCMP3155]|uniref:Uncharacterized protein n=1 Tax=Vitrella brassicaformis (strain CCMP3155) TaxID=1169540 RepID=A0A0G4GVV8_VITBC|nr:unnamed protein product [Vitrella brassicaformis CCMP3155]|eukprot:CEM35066.1 unnamed protein product [Vitrella brassicaformis CCMP3155]
MAPAALLLFAIPLSTAYRSEHASRSLISRSAFLPSFSLSAAGHSRNAARPHRLGAAPSGGPSTVTAVLDEVKPKEPKEPEPEFEVAEAAGKRMPEVLQEEKPATIELRRVKTADPTVFTPDTTESMRGKLYAASAIGGSAGLLAGSIAGGEQAPVLALVFAAVATIEATRNTGAGGKLREAGGAVVSAIDAVRQQVTSRGYDEGLLGAGKSFFLWLDEYLKKNDIDTSFTKQLIKRQGELLNDYLFSPTHKAFTAISEAAVARVGPTDPARYYRSSFPPFYERVTVLRTMGDGVHFLEQPLLIGGVSFGLRSVVIELNSSRDLMVINPVAPTRELIKLVNSLRGTVKAIVVPNTSPEHQPYVQEFLDRCPGAKVYASRLPRDDSYRVDELLSEEAPPMWKGVIEQAVLDGSASFREVVFFHKPSKSLIVTDFCAMVDDAYIAEQNYVDSVVTENTAMILGLYNQTGLLVDRVLTSYPLRNKGFIQRLLSWPFARIVPAHGVAPIKGDASYVRSLLQQCGAVDGGDRRPSGVSSSINVDVEPLKDAVQRSIFGKEEGRKTEKDKNVTKAGKKEEPVVKAAK